MGLLRGALLVFLIGFLFLTPVGCATRGTQESLRANDPGRAAQGGPESASNAQGAPSAPAQPTAEAYEKLGDAYAAQASPAPASKARRNLARLHRSGLAKNRHMANDGQDAGDAPGLSGQ